MKPTFHFSRATAAHGLSFARRTPRSLRTDSEFQGNMNGFFGGGRGQPERSSFRRIGDEYFRSEARGHFAMEAAFFALIVLTAAVPVIESVAGLVRFVYGML